MNHLSLKIPLFIVVFLFLGAATAFAGERSAVAEYVKIQMTADTSSEGTTVGNKKGMLLFFLNPGGRPCQAQARILNEHTPELEKHVDIIGVSTTVAAHRQYFYSYGVRQLPQMILADNDGKPIHRFSPGIHPYEEIMVAIRQLDEK